MTQRGLMIIVTALVCFSGCSSLLYYPAKQPLIDIAKLPHQPHDVFFESEDGTKLHGWYFRSRLSQEGKAPKGTILFFHGNAQNVTTHFMFLYWLLERGWDYLIFDYRGYGRSEGETSPEGTVQDGRAALRWLAKHKSQGPLVIFGQSLGGAVALKVAGDTTNDGLYDKVAVDSTFHSYRKVGQKVLSRLWLTWLFQPVAWLALSDRFGPETEIPRIAPHPLLVIHGTDDKNVDYALGQRVFELAREPKEFWGEAGGQHTDFFYNKNGETNRARFTEWLDRR